MLNPGIVYMLTSVVLFAVAVVVHFHASHLSLPLSSPVSVAAGILPVAAFVNAYIYPNLLRSSHACTAADPVARLAPVVLQALQALATAVLATLLLEALLPSPVLDFLLDRQWSALAAARDGAAIRFVQDAYACCGFDALDDRAYPSDGPPCAQRYARHRPCRGPWTAAMQATSALDLAVVLAVGLMQFLGLLMMRERTLWWTALRTQGWKQGDLADDGSQRLLTPPDDQIDDDEPRPRQPTTRRYGALEANNPAEAQRHASDQ